MINRILLLVVFSSVFALFGCAGMKVQKPEDTNKNAGTMALDYSNGNLKFVGTFTCNMESVGHKFSAVGKTQDAARTEVMAKCKEKTLISFCESGSISCQKN
jgi:hypothetical protein